MFTPSLPSLSEYILWNSLRGQFCFNISTILELWFKEAQVASYHLAYAKFICKGVSLFQTWFFSIFCTILYLNYNCIYRNFHSISNRGKANDRTLGEPPVECKGCSRKEYLEFQLLGPFGLKDFSNGTKLCSLSIDALNVLKWKPRIRTLKSSKSFHLALIFESQMDVKRRSPFTFKHGISAWSCV